MKKLTLALTIVAALSFTGCGTTNTTVEKEDTVVKVEDYKISNADDALKLLKDGNKRFVEDKSELINVTKERRDQLTEGQSPYAVVVSCSDSRVTPTNVFNTGLGEIFDVRIAGNVVDADALGSIEYGAEHAGAPLIVVMGHEKCGAVTAEYEAIKENKPVEGNIGTLVSKIAPSVEGSSSIDEAAHKNVTNTANQIKEDPVIKHLIEEGKVKVVEAFYNLDGKVTFEE